MYRSDFYILPHPIPFVKNFFIFFSKFFSEALRPLPALRFRCALFAGDLYIIHKSGEDVNTFFRFFYTREQENLPAHGICRDRKSFAYGKFQRSLV